MFQPTTLVLALALLVGTAPRAQPSSIRERRERFITATGNPADPPQEVHVARGVTTVLRFKSQIHREGIEVDGRGTRITVDVGDSSIILEPPIELGAAERLVLSVPFDDGQRAVFVLVSHASLVDTRIDVIRHEQTVEACQAELAEVQARCSKISSVLFARAGGLTRKGVISRRIIECNNVTWMAGLVCDEGTAHRAEKWALVDVKIRNAPDQPPWIAREVILKGVKSEAVLSVRTVEMDAAQIAPGETGHVFVEVEPPSADELFVLELRDAAGRGVTVPEVNLNSQEPQR